MGILAGICIEFNYVGIRLTDQLLIESMSLERIFCKILPFLRACITGVLEAIAGTRGPGPTDAVLSNNSKDNFIYYHFSD